MKNKKAQGMPVNVIIIAVIVLIVLIFLIIFFVGGFGNVKNRIDALFSGSVTGQSQDLVVQECQNYCESALASPEGSRRFSAYCTNSFLIDDDGNSGTAPKRMSCGSSSRTPTLTKEDEKRKIEVGGNINVECAVTCSSG